MRRLLFLACLALWGCTDAHAQSVCMGMGMNCEPQWKRSGPTFSWEPDTVVTGASRLPLALTINGETQFPQIAYRGQDATASDWAPFYGTGTLTHTGAALPLAKSTPFNDGTQAVNMKGSSTGYYVAPNTSVMDWGDTGDVWMEAIIRDQTTNSGSRIMAKYDNGTAKGFTLLAHTTAGFRMTIFGGSGADPSTASPGGDGYPTWVYVVWKMDRSATQWSGNLYNGNSGAGISLTGGVEFENTDTFKIGWESGTGGDHEVAYVALYKFDDFGTVPNFSNIQAERFAALVGAYTDTEDTPTFSRGSVAYHSVYDGSEYQLYRTGNSGKQWPRVGDDPALGSGILIEDGHTNLTLRSEQFDNASWTKTRCSIDADNLVGPDGVTSADTIDGTQSAAQFAMVQQAVTWTATDYTVGFWGKPGNVDWARLSVNDGTSYEVFCDFENRVTGTEVNSPDAVGIIGPFKNGFSFCYLTKTLTAGAGTWEIIPAEGDNDTLFAGANDDFHIWGAMSTATDTPVSYVSTTSASAALAPDILEYTLTHSTQGTLYAEYTHHDSPGLLGFEEILALSDDSTVNLHAIFLDSSDSGIHGLSRTSSTTVADIDSGTDGADGVNRVVTYSYNTNDFELYVDGASGGTDTSGAVVGSGLDTLHVGHYPGPTNEFNGMLQKVKHFDEKRIRK